MTGTTLAIVRHGQSEWNTTDLFTGWRDVDLTETGSEEAKRAGIFLRDAGIPFDAVFTSVLQRAVKTAWIIREQLDLARLPLHKTWRLNERHYGTLEGLSETEQVGVHGKDQVHRWRRGYDSRPPQVSTADTSHPIHDQRYADVDPGLLPGGESLADVVARFVPYWDEEIAPLLKAGGNALIVAHEHSLRALVKHLENVSDEDILQVKFRNAVPWIYELDSELSPVNSWFAADAAEME